MKHYAPNHMLAPKEIIYHLSLVSPIGKKYNSINYVSNLFKIYSDHLHLEHKLYAKYHNPSSKGSPDILFTMSLMAKMPKSEKGHNSVKYSQNFTKS